MKLDPHMHIDVVILEAHLIYDGIQRILDHLTNHLHTTYLQQHVKLFGYQHMI